MVGTQSKWEVRMENKEKIMGDILTSEELRRLYHIMGRGFGYHDLNQEREGNSFYVIATGGIKNIQSDIVCTERHLKQLQDDVKFLKKMIEKAYQKEVRYE